MNEGHCTRKIPHDRGKFTSPIFKPELILRVSRSTTAATLLGLASTLSWGCGESTGPTTATIAVTRELQ